METKEQLITLMRVACAHEVQGQAEKAKDAYNKALVYWAQSNLTEEDWDEVYDEYMVAYHLANVTKETTNANPKP